MNYKNHGPKRLILHEKLNQLHSFNQGADKKPIGIEPNSEGLVWLKLLL